MENEDFGFHDFESSISNVSILVLSGFQILPNAGGWNDQYETDADDILTHLRGLMWARSLKGAEDGSQKTGETDDIFTDNFPTIAGGVEAFK